MPDTKRKRSEIIALFADNVNRNISEQDERDFIESVHGSTWSESAAITATPTTLNADHEFVPVDASGGAVTLNLPDRAANRGKVYMVKRLNSGANAVLVVRAGSDTIDGGTQLSLDTQYACAFIVAGATQWSIISTFGTVTKT